MMKQCFLAALGASVFCLPGQLQAASMEAIITGVTGPASFDHSWTFVGGYEDANAASLSFEVTIIWDSQPSGLDAAQSTINLDAGQSSFSLQKVVDPIIVSSANVIVETAGIDFRNAVDWLGWTRTNDAATGTSSLSLSFHGWLSDNTEIFLAIPASDIVSPLPLGFDAAFALADQEFSNPGGAFTFTDADGQRILGLDLVAKSIAFINLDAPVDPAPTDVPLPGALALLVAGLGTLAGLRRARG
jgi:hypothetical protein